MDFVVEHENPLSTSFKNFSRPAMFFKVDYDQRKKTASINSIFDSSPRVTSFWKSILISI